MPAAHPALSLTFGVLLLASVSGVTWGQTTPPTPPEPPARPDRERGEAGLLTQIVEPLELTQSQQEQLRGIAKAHVQRVRAGQQEHADKLDELRQRSQDARSSGDREAAMAARLEMAQLMETVTKPSLQTALGEVEAMLTPEQKAKFAELRPGLERRAGAAGGGQRRPRGAQMNPRRILAMADQLGLTAEQQQQIQAAGADLERLQADQDAGGEVSREDVRAAAEAFATQAREILTPEQLEKLAAGRGRTSPSAEGDAPAGPAAGEASRSTRLKVSGPDLHPRRVLAEADRLGLSAEQRNQVQALGEQTQALLEKAASEGAEKKALDAAAAKLREILTADQVRLLTEKRTDTPAGD